MTTLLINLDICSGAGDCHKVPCYDIFLYHTNGKQTAASIPMADFTIKRKDRFRIDFTEWEITLDGTGTFSILSHCNARGLICKNAALKFPRSNEKGVSYTDCKKVHG